jgi:hypothetical protein
MALAVLETNAERDLIWTRPEWHRRAPPSLRGRPGWQVAVKENNSQQLVTISPPGASARVAGSTARPSRGPRNPGNSPWVLPSQGRVADSPPASTPGVEPPLAQSWVRHDP